MDVHVNLHFLVWLYFWTNSTAPNDIVIVIEYSAKTIIHLDEQNLVIRISDSLIKDIQPPTRRGEVF